MSVLDAAPLANGGDPAGVPLLMTGTDPRTWYAGGVTISNAAGYSHNNLVALRPDGCPVRTRLPSTLGTR
eukprot:SAG11_NODE_3320_length_2525_cov_2.455070_2_plen_70_part_00